MSPLSPSDYTVVWIAVLHIEAEAALHMLDNVHNGRFPMQRGNDYVFLAGDLNRHNIATLPAGREYGTGAAAALASQAKSFFPNLWFGLLVGVAAGLPNLAANPPLDIRLGDVLVAVSDGDSPGLVAYELAHLGLGGAAKRLLEKGASADMQDQDGRTALHWAAENGHEAVVRTLLEKGASADIQDQSGRTALHRAAQNRHEAVIKILTTDED